jgi:hypothetical protein
MKLQLAHDLKGTVEQENSLEIPVEWTSEDVVMAQYLNRGFGNAYDFSQRENPQI